ncbi:hypothetical protein LshimejAT787_0404720 [Lyophyllum shimeji]|uniref:Uncharacterized protein n=1 Tax=Lyophyllum shimeji TaxID=47721 RepID=A0A9P3UNL3_LYOSH|nr:hypothetical protein LshimejAT787_0404720 [Lyophyllum shimeji]
MERPTIKTDEAIFECKTILSGSSAEVPHTLCGRPSPAEELTTRSIKASSTLDMADLLSGQPTAPSVGSTGGGIPPPPSFADFKFTTIGQQPQLLKRISSPTEDFQCREPSSPSPSTLPELEYPSRPVSRSRPSLLQAYTSTDVVMEDVADDIGAANPPVQLKPSSIPQSTRIADQIQAPAARLPTPFRVPIADTSKSTREPFGTVTWGISPIPATSSPRREDSSISIASSTPLGAKVPTVTVPPYTSEANADSSVSGTGPSYQGVDSSYTTLRALQARLLSSLSNLQPPNATQALLLVQAANSHSANALSTAHRSHALAQQSLASAQEALAAAQESLSAAEQAKAHASDAVAAVEQLSSSGMEGNIEWEWNCTITQLQDDLRALGQWVGEREYEEFLKRREADRLARERKHEVAIEAAMRVANAGGRDPLVSQEMNLNVVRKAPEAVAQRSTVPAHAFAPPLVQRQERQRSAELEADAATRAWSLEHGHLPRDSSIATQDGPQLAMEDAGAPSALVRDCEQARTLSPEQAARLAVQREEENRLRELHEKKLEVARFQMRERERVEAEERSNLSTDETRLKRAWTRGPSPSSREVDGIASPVTQSSAVVEEAKRALEAYKEKERASAGKRRLDDEQTKKAVAARQSEEAKRAETRRLLEQRKQRELEELKKRQAEQAAELEREAEVRERKLIAEQERRRQEVMAQKLRASAETAARINAERAREKEKSAAAVPSISPGTTASQSHPDRPTEYGNLVVKKTMTSGSPKKPRSISGGVKLGPTTADQLDQTTPDSLPPSPSVTRSAALGLRVKKAPSNSGSPATTARADDSGHTIARRADTNESKKSHFTDRELSRKPPSTASLTAPPSMPPRSTPTSPADESSLFHVHRRSEDSGNMCVILPSQLPAASPEAQAANLRFVKSNGVLRNTHPEPVPDFWSVKRESPADESPSAPKKENDISATAKESKDGVPVAGGKRIDGELEAPTTPPTGTKISLPSKPLPLPPVRKAEVPNVQDQQASVVRDKAITATTTMNASALGLSIPPPLPVPSVSSPAVALPSSSAQPAKTAVKLKRPPSTLPSSTQAHADSSRGDPALTHQARATPLPLHPLLSGSAAESSASELSGPSRLSEAMQYEDQSQIAPIINDKGGWDRPSMSVDDEGYGIAPRSEAPARPRPNRQRYRRGGDHYSPAPRSPSPPYRSRPLPPMDAPPLGSSRPPSASPLPPEFSPRSPVLGKRRYHEDSRPDEPPSRRRWPPEDERDREQQPYMSRSVWPPRAWRSPSPERPALQARIGGREQRIGNGQSYRPTYASDTYDRPQFRGPDAHLRARAAEYAALYDQGASLHAAPAERPKLGRHSVADSRNERAQPSGKGKGGNTNTLNRGGNRVPLGSMNDLVIFRPRQYR